MAAAKSEGTHERGGRRGHLVARTTAEQIHVDIAHQRDPIPPRLLQFHEVIPRLRLQRPEPVNAGVHEQVDDSRDVAVGVLDGKAARVMDRRDGACEPRQHKALEVGARHERPGLVGVVVGEEYHVHARLNTQPDEPGVVVACHLRKPVGKVGILDVAHQENVHAAEKPRRGEVGAAEHSDRAVRYAPPDVADGAQKRALLRPWGFEAREPFRSGDRVPDRDWQEFPGQAVLHAPFVGVVRDMTQRQPSQAQEIEHLVDRDAVQVQRLDHLQVSRKAQASHDLPVNPHLHDGYPVDGFPVECGQDTFPRGHWMPPR